MPALRDIVRAIFRPARLAAGAARRDRRGVAAVEFALILPLMLTIYVGTVDVTRGVMASRKVDIVSRTLSDLVAQQPTLSTITSAQVQTIFTAASAIMRPFAITNLKMTVSAVTIGPTSANTCCNVTVNWSYTQGGTLRPCATNLTLVASTVPPAATNFRQSLVTANTAIGSAFASSQVNYFVIADVSYVYTPILSQAVPWFKGTMQRTTYMMPRSPSGQVLIATPIAPLSGQSGASC